MATLFEKWRDNEIGNFGGFQTLIFKAYQEAGTNNQEALAKAFPDWFKNDPDQEAYESQRDQICDDYWTIFQNLLQGNSTIKTFEAAIHKKVIDICKKFIKTLPKEFEVDIINHIHEDLEETSNGEGLGTKDQIAFDYLDELVNPDPEAGE